MDLALDLIAEFVFCEVDRRGNRRPAPLPALLELQLLEVLFDYFNGTSNEAAKNTIFLSLFSGTTAMQRLPVLSKLVSIAVGSSSTSVLVATSTWMQQLGNTSINSCKLAEVIVQDYFVLVPSAANRLKSLPDVAPQFTANFITAIAEIYCTKRDRPQIPPLGLLEMITHWVSENPKVCIAAQQIQSSLPPGAISMEATTPIAGLLRWCIVAPLYKQNSDLYTQLHLSLLHSLLDIPASSPPRAVSAQHLSAPCGTILRYISEMCALHKAKPEFHRMRMIMQDGDLQLALDRYAQAVQVALSLNCIYGNVEDLISQLQHLPQTNLLKIVIGTYQQNK